MPTTATMSAIRRLALDIDGFPATPRGRTLDPVRHEVKFKFEFDQSRRCYTLDAWHPGILFPRRRSASARRRLHKNSVPASSCWKPPTQTVTHHVDITVVFAFNRSGELMGQPRITYQAADVPDPDRQAYKVAVMDTLQRCSPMPFTEAMGAAVAGHPFAVRFMSEPPTFPSHPSEKRAWLSLRIL